MEGLNAMRKFFSIPGICNEITNISKGHWQSLVADAAESVPEDILA